MLNSQPKYIYNSVKGASHQNNEDGIIVVENENYGLYLLLDGVSSAKNSLQAIAAVRDFIAQNHQEYLQKNSINILELMRGVHKNILLKEVPEMLSTYAILFLAFKKNVAKFSAMGDTRIYEVTNQSLRPLTNDDVLPLSRNVLTKCLGDSQIDDSDFTEQETDPSSKRFLICTDGFWEKLEGDKLNFHKVLNFKNITNIKKHLDDLLEREEPQDDASYLLLDQYV